MHLMRPGTRLRQQAVRGRSLSSGKAFPGSLPGLAFTMLPALSREQGRLWQDAAKTTAATANGDPVRVAVCPFTAAELTAPTDAARPLLTDEGSGRWSLTFDGVDDRFLLSSPGSYLLNPPGLWWGYAALLTSIAAGRGVFRAAHNGDGGATGWGQVFNTSGGGFLQAIGRSSAAAPIAAQFAWSDTVTTVVSTAGWDLSTDTVFTRRVGGSEVTTGGANASNTDMTGLAVGSSSATGASAFWAGRIRGLFVCSATQPADTTRTAAETYLGAL